MTLSPSLSGEPLTGAVNTQFASRPTLAAVTRQLLATTLAQTYPTLSIDLTRTVLLTPTSRGGWRRQSLMALVLDLLANGTALDFSARHGRSCRLSDYPPAGLTLADAQPLDMQATQALIETLLQTLPAALQNALAAYWNDASDSGMTRWHWLGDALRDTLHMMVIQENDLMPQEREMLDQLINDPHLDQRIDRYGEAAVHAYFPMATLTTGRQTQQLLGPDLILVPVFNGQAHILWCTVAGGYKRFNNMDSALQDWARRLETDAVVERITTQRFETDGHLFDAQSALILNRQLQQLHHLKLGTQFGLEALRAVYQHITDPIMSFDKAAVYTSQTLVTLRRDLPQWLSQATPAERMRYRHYSLQLASAKKRSEGLTFLSDVPDIRTFTQTALLNQLLLDEIRFDNVRPGQSRSAQFQPDDLQLTFQVAAGYPGGAGYVEKRHMSLTELAINNLQGRPSGQLSVAHRTAQPLPAWLTADYIQGSSGLIQQVNIGKTYPELLKARLLGDSEETRQRERRFAEQTTAQLCLLALESSLRKLDGLTPQGAALVAALVGNHEGRRVVDGHDIVIRQLALLRKPNATPDAVANMYIIEPENDPTGPHILYRPLYAQALLQFSSREQLMSAIALPGELQNSVLAWLSDGARPVYEDGGFQQPHYVRFGAGDEFELPEIPTPATLAKDGASDELLQFLANGQLMQYLYGANARALVDQAERESVSNAESRWKVFLEGAGLLFGTLLLPLARGPLMLTGWLLSLLASANRDIPALNSQDPVTRELAWADLLLNVGMLLFELIPTPVTPKRLLSDDLKWQSLHSPLDRRTAEQWPPYPAPLIQEGPVMLGGGSPALADSVFDFSFTSARQRLTADQQQRLWQLQAPRPQVLPEQVLTGAYRGLYKIQRDWYALFDTRWYQVDLEGGNVMIVDALNPQHHGPALQTDGQGNWSLDLRLRLRGGMPPKRIAAARERKAQRKQQLVDDQAHFISGRQQALQAKVDTAQQQMSQAASNARYTDAARADTRKNFDRALHEQINAYQTLLDARPERAELGIPMPVNFAVVFLENTVNNARKSVVVADMDRQVLYAENPDFNRPYEQVLPSIIVNQPRYAQFLKDMSHINDRQIQALELKDRYLLELFNLGQTGLEAFNRLTLNRPDELSALSLKYLQLKNLKYLSQKNWRSGLFINELDLALDPLGPHLRTHSELNLLNINPADRIAVLDSLFLQYGQAVDALQGVARVHADMLDNSYFQPLQALVASLYQDVLLQLAAEVKPLAESPKKPPNRALAMPGKLQKKVIKTRRQGILIGDVKPADSTLSIDTVEVRSEQADQLLATYSEHENGWDEVRYQRQSSVPELPPNTRALNIVKGDARKWLKTLEPTIKRQEGYAQMSRYPIEIQESLEAQASRFEALAAELDRAIAAQSAPLQLSEDRVLADNLRAAAVTLTTKGRELRLQRTLELPPTDSHLTFLLEHKHVKLGSLGERLKMTGKREDFIKEYSVIDQHGEVLWYAHFHYPKVDTPKMDMLKPGHTVAHLKKREQRTDNYYSLLAAAKNPRDVVEVYRGTISDELAKRWFLPLIP